jgi:hypothetical protein
MNAFTGYTHTPDTGYQNGVKIHKKHVPVKRKQDFYRPYRAPSAASMFTLSGSIRTEPDSPKFTLKAKI